MSLSITFEFEEDGTLIIEDSASLTKEQWEKISRFAIRKYFGEVGKDQAAAQEERDREFGL